MRSNRALATDPQCRINLFEVFIHIYGVGTCFPQYYRTFGEWNQSLCNHLHIWCVYCTQYNQHRLNKDVIRSSLTEFRIAPPLLIRMRQNCIYNLLINFLVFGENKLITYVMYGSADFCFPLCWQTSREIFVNVTFVWVVWLSNSFSIQWLGGLVLFSTVPTILVTTI